MNTEQLIYILRDEASKCDQSDYKHQAAARLEEITAQLSASEQRVKALEDTLLLVQVLLIHISARGHKSGYNWNSDPEKLTLTEGEIHERINKALEATCTNTPKG